MDLTDPGQLAVLAGGGLLGGLFLLVRGFAGYGAAIRIADTAPSRIASIAVGEVLVSGTVEAAELTLVSPLQSATCVYYRSAVSGSSTRETEGRDFREERAVGFRVRDPSGTVRIFPRGARFDVPDRVDERSTDWQGLPPGLLLRTGGAYGQVPSREAQVAALLTVRRAEPTIGGALPTQGLRRYTEARIDLGDVVTVIGRALPFDQLPDPTGADHAEALDPLLADPEIAADLAAARAAGLLADTPEEAWGNAAIPGFGIGRPVRSPELDPGAIMPTLADPAEEAMFEHTFDLRPDALVLAADADHPLAISLGSPAAAADRHESRFVVGLLGAIVAIGSAVVMAAALGGWLAR